MKTTSVRSERRPRRNHPPLRKSRTPSRLAGSSSAPRLVTGRSDIGLWRMDLARGDARSLGSFGATPPVYAMSTARGGEAWIAHDGLTRLNLASLEAFRAPIDWVPARIATIPARDGVLVDVPRRNTVVRLDGNTGQIDRECPLHVPAPPAPDR